MLGFKSETSAGITLFGMELIYAASSAKTSNGERLSFPNWFLRIMWATSMHAMVAETEWNALKPPSLVW